MTITIYHYSNCSKSREAFERTSAFASNHGLALTVVEYLKTPPTLEKLLELQTQLGVGALAMIRQNEEKFTAMDLSGASDTALLEAIASCPQLLQRPIIVCNGQAIIARPPELVENFLKRATGLLESGN
jgi:arsenate reductase (glutaredoxin)